MAGDGDDIDVAEEVRAAVYTITARLLPRQQKAFLVAIAAPEIALISHADATMMIDVLGLPHL